MSGRPRIPKETRREVLFEARHHCAVCCVSLPLQFAHIIPWRTTHEHTIENLIALCPNCHGRADGEKWDESYLRKYKLNPCILAQQSPPVMSPEQKAIVDLIIASDPEMMNERQRERLVSMIAAYAGVAVTLVRVESVSVANSSRVRVSLPIDAMHRLISGFREEDQLLNAFLDDIELLDVQEVGLSTADRMQRTNTSELCNRLSPSDKRTGRPSPDLKGGSMPILVTIVLDSGAFLQNIDEDPSELDVGYFQSGKDHAGNDVPDIHAYADAEEVAVRHNKLGQGKINVIRTKGGAPVAGIKISDSLKRNLLRKVDLYGKHAPDYDRQAIECIIHFTSGHFRCSKVKNRRFIEVLVSGYGPTGNEKHIRPIAHDVLVHFQLADDEELRLERENGPVLFSTGDVKAGTKHVEIELVTNNATAKQFFCDALDLTGRTHCWLPNQGDPTAGGMP